MRSLSIFGTSSDAGKSTLTWLLGALLQERGFSVAPFKAQNVSNNAAVADDGSEIAYAQYFQARMMHASTSWHNNPVLLKSGYRAHASLILRGQSAGHTGIGAYYRNLDKLKPAVNEAFEVLQTHHDIVLAEGAGSPVELNLMDKDLANIHIAQTFNTAVILVADIEKGGVFASIYGVYHLLPEALRRNVVGVVINKFRGDMRFFDEGVRIIERDFGIPVLGVLPYMPLNVGFEDSQSLAHYTQDCTRASRRIAVIAYPYMSNYTDIEPLITDPDVCVEFVRFSTDVRAYDEIILPGSKRVMEDMRWLKRTGLFDALQRAFAHGTPITGICGGFEMMCREIVDEEGIETGTPMRETALGWVDDSVSFKKTKILKRDGVRYQLRHGRLERTPDIYRKGHIVGTFWHGWLEDEAYLARLKKIRAEMLAITDAHLDTQRLLDALC